MRKGVKSLDPDAPGVGKQAMLDWMHINHPKIPIKTGASREEVARKVKEVQPNRKYITSWVLFHLSHLSAWHFIKRCFSFWGHILIVFASMPIAQTSHEPEAASVPIELPILPPPDSLFLSKLSNIKLSKKKRSPSLENKPVPNKAVLTKKPASKVRTQPLSAQAEGTSELSVREDLPKAKKKKGTFYSTSVFIQRIALDLTLILFNSDCSLPGFAWSGRAQRPWSSFSGSKASHHVSTIRDYT